MRIDEGVETTDESVTAANIENAAGCEVQLGDGIKITREAIPPPSWRSEEE
jgi:hypothetical protein